MGGATIISLLGEGSRGGSSQLEDLHYGVNQLRARSVGPSRDADVRKARFSINKSSNYKPVIH